MRLAIRVQLFLLLLSLHCFKQILEHLELWRLVLEWGYWSDSDLPSYETIL